MKATPSDSISHLQAMRLGINYRHPIVIRGFTLQVRPLTHMEQVETTQEVSAVMMDLPESARNRITEHSILCKKILVKASTSDVDANDPQITEMVLDRMTNEELQFLFKQYVSITDKCNPSLDAISINEVNELVADLKKNPTQLTELTFLQSVNIVRYLLTNDGRHQDN